MKKIFFLPFATAIAIVLFSITFTGCKSEPKDADIKTAAETVLKADPMSAGTRVEVKDGIATISGECMDDACKKHCAQLVADIKGVKSVVNNCTVMPMMEKATTLTDDELNKHLYDLIKDLSSASSIKIGAMDGIVAIAGPMPKKEWETLKVEIDKLKPKGYDTTMLSVQ